MNSNRSLTSHLRIFSQKLVNKLNLPIAHQYIEQMSDEVRAAVFGNVGTMITFRVGAYDAETLEKEFAPYFELVDLVNLGFAQIYLKLMIDGVTSQPFSATTLPPIEKPLVSSKDLIMKASREQFAQERLRVEDNIKEWHQPIIPARAPERPMRPQEPVRQERYGAPRPVLRQEPARQEVSVSRQEPVRVTRQEMPREEVRQEAPKPEPVRVKQEPMKTTIKAPEPRKPTPPPSDIQPERESLLSREPKKKNGANDLKDALAAVLKKAPTHTQQAHTPVSASAPVSDPVPPKQEKPKEPEGPKEVPEADLRKIFKME